MLLLHTPALTLHICWSRPRAFAIRPTVDCRPRTCPPVSSHVMRCSCGHEIMYSRGRRRKGQFPRLFPGSRTPQPVLDGRIIIGVPRPPRAGLQTPQRRHHTNGAAIPTHVCVPSKLFPPSSTLASFTCWYHPRAMPSNAARHRHKTLRFRSIDRLIYGNKIHSKHVPYVQ